MDNRLLIRAGVHNDFRYDQSQGLQGVYNDSGEGRTRKRGSGIPGCSKETLQKPGLLLATASNRIKNRMVCTKVGERSINSTCGLG
jgi:hypothetical protein